MPLIKKKSKKAFEHNLKAEMHAGKPKDQSLAIAFDVQRRAGKAHGGKVGKEQAAYHHESKEEKPHRDPKLGDIFKDRYFSGGKVRDKKEPKFQENVPSREEREANEPSEYHKKAVSSIEDAFKIKKAHGGMIDDIMENRRRKRYADGGMVDLEESLTEDPANPNAYDKQNELAAEDDLLDDSLLESDPLDSNEHSDDIDKDIHDMVAIIRRKLRMRHE